MNALFLMWRDTKMIVLTAVVGALYVAAYVTLAPFSIALVPGVIVISARDALIMLFGVLFGPAGAWGLGIGNTIGDLLTGNFGPGSVFGFLTNFIVAYLGYVLWSTFGPTMGGRPLSDEGRARRILIYMSIGAVSAAAGALVLGWGLNVLGLAPFRVVAVTLFFNLMIGSWIGGWLYLLLWRRVDSLNLTWTSIMRAETNRQGFVNPWIGLFLVAIGGGVGLIDAIFLVNGSALDSVIGGFFGLVIVGAVLLGYSRRSSMLGQQAEFAGADKVLEDLPYAGDA